MKKVFVNPKASIKHIINKAKEWNGFQPWHTCYDFRATELEELEVD